MGFRPRHLCSPVLGSIHCLDSVAVLSARDSGISATHTFSWRVVRAGSATLAKCTHTLGQVDAYCMCDGVVCGMCSVARTQLFIGWHGLIEKLGFLGDL